MHERAALNSCTLRRRSLLHLSCREHDTTGVAFLIILYFKTGTSDALVTKKIYIFIIAFTYILVVSKPY